jgi:hypothetical protein
MITLKVISPENTPMFKDVRLRALRDSPIALSLTYTENQLSGLSPVRSLLVTSAVAMLSRYYGGTFLYLSGSSCHTQLGVQSLMSCINRGRSTNAFLVKAPRSLSASPREAIARPNSLAPRQRQILNSSSPSPTAFPSKRQRSTSNARLSGRNHYPSHRRR